MEAPDSPPASVLALMRSLGVAEEPLNHPFKQFVRQVQNVVPRANVCMLDAVANRNGVVPLKIPAVPPNRNPAPPAVVQLDEICSAVAKGRKSLSDAAAHAHCLHTYRDCSS